MGDKNKTAKDAAGFRNPHNLPTKICAGCGKPFTWRKKWERDWENVRYCSDACKSSYSKP
ncbi:MAG: DUF2256 domain-containing protein [Armatimonadetes bacterium]|nr:DUF2256 domain-containing protein [Armatimonadota bacterium]